MISWVLVSLLIMVKGPGGSGGSIPDCEDVASSLIFSLFLRRSRRVIVICSLCKCWGAWPGYMSACCS